MIIHRALPWLATLAMTGFVGMVFAPLAALPAGRQRVVAVSAETVEPVSRYRAAGQQSTP